MTKRLMRGAQFIGDYPEGWQPPIESDLHAGIADGSMVFVPTPPVVPPPVDPRLAADETERLAAKVDNQILPLVNQTRAEWITWAGANFPSLTAAEKTRLGILFWVVSVGVRRSIR